MIHNSVICFLPFYWISKIKINKFTLTLYWIVVVTSFLLKNELLVLLQKIVGYEEYDVLETAGGENFIFFLYILLIFTTIFYKQFLNNKMNEISINALFISEIFFH